MTAQHKKTVLNLLLYGLALILVCAFGPRLLRFFMPIVIGWIIAWVANPLVRFFEQHLKILRKHGSLVVIVGVLALVVTACYFVIAWIVEESVAFVGSIPDAYSAARQGFGQIAENLSGLLGFLPANVQADLTEFVVNMDAYIGELIGTIGGSTLSFAGDLVQKMPNLLVMGIFMLLAAYFFVADKVRINAVLDQLFPDSLKQQWQWIKGIFYRAVGGYFIAQFKIMGVIAVILFVGFKLLGVEHAVLLALLIAFLDFIPFLGTGTAIWPWAAFQLLTGNFVMAAGLMGIYCICLPVHQILQPKFVGDTVGMDPLWTLIFMFIGYRISGMLGMIVSIPLGMMLISMYREGAFNKTICDVRDLVRDINAYRKS